MAGTLLFTCIIPFLEEASEIHHVDSWHKAPWALCINWLPRLKSALQPGQNFSRPVLGPVLQGPAREKTVVTQRLQLSPATRRSCVHLGGLVLKQIFWCFTFNPNTTI